MNCTRGGPRLRDVGRDFRWSSLAQGGLLCLLVACGGGDGDATTTTTPAAGPAVGDYYVYAYTVTPTVPANSSVMNYNVTTTFKSVASDGSNERALTYGGVAGAYTNATYNADGSQTGWSSRGTPPAASCVYSPAGQFVPAFPRAVGQSWTQTHTQTCSGNTITAPTTATVSGRITGIEDVTVPAGTFSSYRAERSTTSTRGTEVTTQTETCWYAVSGGMVVRCTANSTTTPAGSSVPISAQTTQRTLTAYGGPNKTPQGNHLARFHGLWQVPYVGAETGTCVSLYVTAPGAITGSCTPTGGVAFSVSGSVTADGTISVTLPNGGTLTGSLTTPYSGSGTWQRGAASGTWTAFHM